jgi:hypothetical protein
MQSVSKFFIWTVLASLLLLTESFSATAMACNYYASPSGGGNGLSPATPFKIANFWSVAGPGKTLCLLDGVYTDSSSMIKPPQNLNGTSTQKITIKALNDGQVTINGGGVREPVVLQNNDHFILEGFNAHNSSDFVIAFRTGADNNILRRVIAWDGATTQNNAVISTNGNTGNLFEDIAAFGSGRKMISNSQEGNKLTIRRAWAMWNGPAATGPKNTYNLGYNSSDSVCENCIGTYDSANGAENEPTSIFRLGPANNTARTPRYLGSIAYVLSSQTFTPGRLVLASEVTTAFLKDVVLYTEQSKRALQLNNPEGMPCVDCRVQNVTTIGGTGNTIGSEWQTSNLPIVSSLGATTNIWNGSGTSGARVCKQYHNGTLTSTPLWPWPMNQRIIDAMRVAGRTPVDVTKTMEQIFGTIPSECRSGSVASAAPTPTSVAVPTTPSVPTSPTSLRAQ